MDAWETLSAQTRQAVIEALTKKVWEKLNAEVGAFYANRHDLPNIRVFATDPAPAGGVTIHFLADHYVWNYAFSGSDWADHYFGRGAAVVRDDKLVGEQFVRTHSIRMHVPEEEADFNDHGSKILELILLEELARLRGTPVDEDAVLAVLSAIRGGVYGTVIAQYKTERGAPGSALTSRCPKCRSMAVGVADVAFENVLMRCYACLHEQYVDSGDHDAWTAQSGTLPAG